LQKSPNTIISVDVVAPSGTGVNEFNISPNISIFPNPTTNNLTFNCQQKSKIKILNIQCQIIKTFETKENETNLDVSSFSRGIYLISVETDKGVWRGKFVKE